MASFNSVSLDPPLILFSVDRRNLSLPDLSAVGTYAVNVLEEAQQDLSNRFAKANSDKWGGMTAFRNQRADAVLLPDSLATFECEPYAQYDGGDHVIFVGRVNTSSSASEGRPLVFFGGRYHTLNGAHAAFGLNRRRTNFLENIMIKNGTQHIASLRDGRQVYINGKAVGDVTAHPRSAIRFVATRICTTTRRARRTSKR